MSRRRKGKKLDGVLLLDKSSGMTSNAALQKARRLFDAQKAGHVGTLDPLASGLLPLCFGEATKFAADLLNADKTYLAEVKFGETTDTGDAEGEVIASSPVEFTEDDLQATLRKFIGEQLQTPPMYSALKVNGRKLYDLARQGQTIDREPRKILIADLKLIHFQFPKALIEVTCSKGTYIRVLGEDIGKALGCGAHLTGLRRTKVGCLSVTDAVTLSEIESLGSEERLPCLFPVDRLLSTLRPVTLKEKAAERFLNGQSLRLESALEEELVRVYKGSVKPENLLGKGRITDSGLLVAERLKSTAQTNDSNLDS